MPSAPRHANTHRIDGIGRLDFVAAGAYQLSGRGSEVFAGLIERRDDPREVLRRQERIGIAESDEIAARDSNRLICRGCESAVRGVDDLAAVWECLAHAFSGMIGGRVIDVDQLDVGMRLARDTVEAAAQIWSAVPGDQDDGDASPHRSNALFRTPM